MKYISLSFKSATTYKSSTLFSTIGVFVFIMVQITLWKYLFTGNESKINYMTSYVVFSSLITILYTKDMYNLISQKVIKGDFVLELIKPINFIVSSYFKCVGILLTRLIFRGLPLLIFIPFVYKNVSLENLGAALLAVILGHYIFVILYSIVGLSTFVLIESWAFQRLLDDTIRFISGSVIPLSIFPDYLQTLSRFLPFQYLYYFPLTLLLGDLDKAEAISGFVVSAIWAIFLTICLFLFYKKSIKRIVVQGG